MDCAWWCYGDSVESACSCSDGLAFDQFAGSCGESHNHCFGAGVRYLVILSIVNHVVATNQIYFAPVLTGVILVRNVGGAGFLDFSDADV